MNAGFVDAHFHCWRLARGDYGWLTPALGAIHRDVRIDDWAREAAPHGVHAGVLVQAAPTEAETAFLLEQAAAHPAVQVVVGWVDLERPDAARHIEQLGAAHPRLKGLRPMLHDLADPDWILDPALAPALEAMAARGLVFDALIRPLHLPRIRALCRRHPALQVVVDHGAKPDIAGAAWQPWADELERLAAESGAACKLSGLLTEAADNAAPGAVQRWARHVIDAFGTQRVIWGSDWPVLERAASYAHWWSETAAILVPLGPEQRLAVLGGNARRVYRLS